MGDLQVFETVESIQDFINDLKEEGHSIAFVPTMGALHHGHLSLVEEGFELAEYVVVSIFVNPMQFDNKEDLEKYPRTLEEDLEKLSVFENIAVFSPGIKDIYPDNYEEIHIDLGQLDRVLEAKFRPGHFNGVVNVVNRLFDIIQPDYAVFGEKDFQQLAVIQRMVKLLKKDVIIVPCPIMREETGLASSSRNERLSDNDKDEALIIYKTLNHLKELARTKPLAIAIEDAKSFFNKGSLELEYLEVVDPETFEILDDWIPGANACIAAYCNGVRLIDNMQMMSKAVFC